MALDDAHRTIIETCLSRIEARRGSAFTAEQPDRVWEVAEMETRDIGLGESDGNVGSAGPPLLPPARGRTTLEFGHGVPSEASGRVPPEARR